MDSNVYKILTIEEWENAQRNNLLSTSLDNKDGFVHLSTKDQLGKTLELYFSEEQAPVIISLDYQ